jgi:hypothetical protein
MLFILLGLITQIVGITLTSKCCINYEIISLDKCQGINDCYYDVCSSLKSITGIMLFDHDDICHYDNDMNLIGFVSNNYNKTLYQCSTIGDCIKLKCHTHLSVKKCL